VTRRDGKNVPEPASDHFSAFLAFIAREDVVGAAHHLNQISDLGFRIRILVPARGVLELRIIDGPDDAAVLSKELLGIEARELGRGAIWAFRSACVSLAQTLYRRGERDKAQLLLSAYQRRHGSAETHIVRDVEFAQSRFAEEREQASVLVRNLAIGGLDYLEYFKGKYCQHPFDDFEVRSDGETFVCCPSFLPYSIGNLFNVKSPDDLTSSPMLDKLKDSILRQDFRYCRWMQCNKIKNGLPELPAEPKTDYRPVDFRLSYDPTCNLWCPSCRTEKIVAKGEQRERILRLTDETILPLLKTARTCMMNGYGDVFASKACRKILETANREDFPHLKFDFITNGVLFTRVEWEKFPGIHRMVRSIRVSIDAARKETYDQVRLGGDWDMLMENLEFIASLRRRGVIETFMISMVVQDNNFSEMADFALMARRLDCDHVIFEPIMNWNTFPLDVFGEKAVHYGSHSKHRAFREELSRVHETLGQANEEARQRHVESDSSYYHTSASVNF
jgi:hypothetical protein